MPSLDTLAQRVDRGIWWLQTRTIGSKCPVCASTGIKRMAFGRTFLECTADDCKFLWCHDSRPAKAHRGMGLVGSWGGVERGGERDDFLVRFLGEQGAPNQKVLIYGAGTTKVFRVLLDEGFDVYGADVSPEVVAYRQSEFPGRFFHADDLEGRVADFDVITACEVFEHFHDPTRWVGLLIRLLKPQGILCGSTNFYPGTGRIEDDGQRIGYMSLDGHVAYWSDTAFARCCQLDGLATVSFELVCPGSVKPDLAWNSLFPNKRFFFASRDGELIATLEKHRVTHPILDCDTSDYPIAAYREDRV